MNADVQSLSVNHFFTLESLLTIFSFTLSPFSQPFYLNRKSSFHAVRAPVYNDQKPMVEIKVDAINE